MVTKKKFSEKLMTDRCDKVRQYLIEVREGLNLSASEVAKSLGWQIYRLWRIENGAGLSLEDAVDLSSKYGLELSEIAELVDRPLASTQQPDSIDAWTQEAHENKTLKRTKPVCRQGRHRSKNGTTRQSSPSRA